MTYNEALLALSDDPHIWRYSQLVEDEDERVREAWRARVVRMALGLPEPESPAPVEVVAESLPAAQLIVVDPWNHLIRACEDYNPACCANPAPWCSRFDIVPPREKCIECLTSRGITP